MCMSMQKWFIGTRDCTLGLPKKNTIKLPLTKNLLHLKWHKITSENAEKY